MMNELKHEQARYYLHIGKADLSGVERESLDRHLSECADCKSYAAELGTLQSTLSQAMHSQWDALAPTAATNKKIQTRIRRKIVQTRVLNLTGSLASSAILLGFIVVAAWFFRPPLSVPVNPGSAPVPTRVNMNFGNMITLVGYDVSKDQLNAGDTLTVTLFWQAHAAPPVSYLVFAHLQDENLKLLAQSDAVPANGTRPTTGWKPDEVIEDRREIKLPSDIQPGRYQLIVGLYDPKTGTRLTTTGGKASLELATVDVK